MFNIGYWLGGFPVNERSIVSPQLVMFTCCLTTVCVFVAVPSARSQTTLTWNSPGANSDIGNGPNWVGGVAPNFAGDTTTDSAIFSTSTNTAVQLRNVTTGDPFATVLFDASAPAYSFANATNELVILRAGNITNNSATTQTMTDIAALTLSGPTGTGLANKIVAANGNVATNLSFDFNQIKYNNAGSNSNTGAPNTAFLDLVAGFDIRTKTLLGVKNGTVSSSLYVQGDTTAGTGGTLFITGDSGTNTGRLAIDSGAKVRISHNNSLGVNSPGATTDHTLLLGNSRNGRLELTGGITVNETFTLQARLKYAANTTSRLPAFVNVGGTNTLTGEIRYSGGGSAYNFGSEAGTLVIQSNLDLSLGGVAADRYFTFLGAGNFVVNGNLMSGTGAGSNAAILKFGTGTAILNGAGNTGIGHVTVSEGTLAPRFRRRCCVYSGHSLSQRSGDSRSTRGYGAASND